MSVFVKKSLLFVLIFSFLYSCKSTYINKNITRKIETSFYNDQFTGVLVFNPKTNDTVFKYNANKYFIPASNTKIFTLYTALQFLPNQIPAFKYTLENDKITIQGTGDPTFLHTFFNDSTALKMARNYKNVNIVFNNLEDDKFGPGWAWEDYDAYFSPERSSFPIYGNVLTINGKDSLQSIPKILKQSIKYTETSKRRNYNENIFFYNLKKQDTIEIPMVIDTLFIKKLWQDVLPGKISISNYIGKKMEHIAYSVPSDSLYKRMMEVSDNFLAEQILILASSTMSDTLNSNKVREYILNNQLKDLKQKPRWVDGSGLSRYNLFAPISFVQVLTKLYNEIPRDRLFNLFPIGGETGTLKKYYSGISKPYIYAKSGTIGNNYSLSGYLITNSGETLVFSFMNNHYLKPSVEVKKRMQSVFEWLRDNY
ncbi:D-alanyl-D-alanine carboxypeptidase / D-alanyl-D-alanine-endopeptidase (penicillin-binding protein 4) [Flaviramulus basaltis]|uniref:D-alanyl-D-alanine carboxypeptidase / D-alanyl-D-alanine-endopeptidase (Penicillin-binding protein 4) n=1 Tax=Flaviramulus basaltis TaxID=369401 RepID=A0A1K2ID53_9FLAO|nr:D-alanyl-D-alanine carboxypeptidase [Flaviramulus basaltis]SFZ90321.1 D-alanyl-D-alanine carboxypeptidase / D-alanyl-D-alanine-endopeptidase (penicillin-binding protein 4) [Flaviramulus basaltis]